MERQRKKRRIAQRRVRGTLRAELPAVTGPEEMGGLEVAVLGWLEVKVTGGVLVGGFVDIEMVESGVLVEPALVLVLDEAEVEVVVEFTYWIL